MPCPDSYGRAFPEPYCDTFLMIPAVRALASNQATVMQLSVNRKNLPARVFILRGRHAQIAVQVDLSKLVNKENGT